VTLDFPTPVLDTVAAWRADLHATRVEITHVTGGRYRLVFTRGFACAALTYRLSGALLRFDHAVIYDTAAPGRDSTVIVALLHVAMPGFPILVGRCARCGDRMPMRDAAGRCDRCGDDRLSVLALGRAAGLFVTVAGYVLAAYAGGITHTSTMRDPAAFLAFAALLLLFSAVVLGAPGGPLRPRRCVFLDGIAPTEKDQDERETGNEQ
jgi:hypothetical protein